MSAYSILMLRCPLFFKRRKYSKVKGLRLRVFDKLSLPMIGVLCTAVPTLRCDSHHSCLCHLFDRRIDVPHRHLRVTSCTPFSLTCLG